MSVTLPTRHEPLTALHQAICRLEETQIGQPIDSDRFYGYHQLPIPEFLEGLSACGEPRGRFLDLGCGAGSKLLIAHFLGWPSLVGVEHDENLARIAANTIPEAEIRNVDAFSADCFGFDVVYTYRLCRDLGEQRELGSRIAESATHGTFVFYAGAEFPAGERIAESVWRV